MVATYEEIMADPTLNSLDKMTLTSKLGYTDDGGVLSGVGGLFSGAASKLGGAKDWLLGDRETVETELEMSPEQITALAELDGISEATVMQDYTKTIDPFTGEYSYELTPEAAERREATVEIQGQSTELTSNLMDQLNNLISGDIGLTESQQTFINNTYGSYNEETGEYTGIMARVNDVYTNIANDYDIANANSKINMIAETISEAEGKIDGQLTAMSDLIRDDEANWMTTLDSTKNLMLDRENSAFDLISDSYQKAYEYASSNNLEYFDQMQEEIGTQFALLGRSPQDPTAMSNLMTKVTEKNAQTALGLSAQESADMADMNLKYSEIQKDLGTQTLEAQQLASQQRLKVEGQRTQNIADSASAMTNLQQYGLTQEAITKSAGQDQLTALSKLAGTAAENAIFTPITGASAVTAGTETGQNTYQDYLQNQFDIYEANQYATDYYGDWQGDQPTTTTTTVDSPATYASEALQAAGGSMGTGDATTAATAATPVVPL